MIPTLDDTLVGVAMVAGAVWLLLALARFRAVLLEAKVGVLRLESAMTLAARELLHRVQNVQKMDEEIVRTKAAMKETADEQAARRKALQESKPPPAPEIYVAAEFPSSRRDVAWLAQFRRLGDGQGPSQRDVLFWSIGRAAALMRAEQLNPKKTTYQLDGVRRFVGDAEPEDDDTDEG